MRESIICIGREYGSGGREIGEKLPRMTMSGNTFADTAIMMHNFYSDDGRAVHSVCETMKELASRQSCVIIGRCASAFLKDYSILSVFIYADYDDCVQRIMKICCQAVHWVLKAVWK